MAPAFPTPGASPSPAGNLKVETEIIDLVIQDKPKSILIAPNEGLATTPTTPDVLDVKLKLFQKVFDEHMENTPVKHDQGHVLLLSWDPDLDDLNVQSEVESLRSTFIEKYGFEVTWEKLGEKPARELNVHLSSFMLKHDAENTLLIIYYAGHGVYENNSVQWQPTRRELTDIEKRRNRIAWSAAENNITNAYADVLVIFDCCQAGGFGGHKVRSADPQFDFIAACGKGERTRNPGKKSFTSALMWALEQLQKDAPFTSMTLVEKIKTYMHLPKHEQTPELLRRDNNGHGVWIGPVTTGSEPEAVAKSVRRKPLHEYIDLRFDFYRTVEPKDAENLAKKLSHLVNNEQSFAKQITLVDVNSVFHEAVSRIMRKTSMGDKRRKPSMPSTHKRKSSPEHPESATLSPMKRQRSESLHSVTTTEAKETQGATYHIMVERVAFSESRNMLES